MQEEQAIQCLQGFDPRLIFKNAPVLQPGTGDFLVGGDTRLYNGFLVISRSLNWMR